MSVNLILKSSDIFLSNTANDYFNKDNVSDTGFISNYRTSFKWNNIDMKVLLSDLYDKYERFNISLIYVSGSATGSSAESVSNKRSLQVKLSGLPFLSSYNQKQNLNNAVVTCSCLQIPTSANTTWESKNNLTQFFSFTKVSMCSISIDLHTIFNDLSPQVSLPDQMIGHCLFSFQITGDTIIDNMANRIPIDTYGYNQQNKKSSYI
jgi:hypothetical protein